MAEDRTAKEESVVDAPDETMKTNDNDANEDRDVLEEDDDFEEFDDDGKLSFYI